MKKPIYGLATAILVGSAATTLLFADTKTPGRNTTTVLAYGSVKTGCTLGCYLLAAKASSTNSYV